MKEQKPTRRNFLLGALFGIPALSVVGWESQKRSVQGRSGNLTELTATEAVALLRTGDLSSEKYTTALLEQCRKHRPLNAFIWQDEAQVLEAARSADKQRTAGKIGILHGLPILVKDNIETAHAPTTAGTPTLRNNRPHTDAPTVASLFSAGAVMLGKTNMHELADGATSNNGAFGAVHNPYDLTMIPGGSSGGNGAAIAARMCTAGLGTDTGGSVRIPASLCGIVGLRPTHGRYPAAGIIPLAHTRDTVGPMARSVKDLVLLDSVIVPNRAPLHPAQLKGIRLGVPRGYFFDNLDSSIVPIVEKALARLRDAGCVLVEADIPDLEKHYTATAAPITYYETLHDISRYLKESGTNTTMEELVSQIASPDVKSLIETSVLGPQAPTRQAYETAMTQARPAFQAVYRDYFRKHNVAALAFPTTVVPARLIGDDSEIELNGKKVPTLLTYLHNTKPMTLVGIPGLSLPIGVTAAGLPVGLELDAPEGKDRDLLSVGLALETLFGSLSAPKGFE